LPKSDFTQNDSRRYSRIFAIIQSHITGLYDKSGDRVIQSVSMLNDLKLKSSCMFQPQNNGLKSADLSADDGILLI
jgi:hypothetical protein